MQPPEIRKNRIVLDTNALIAFFAPVFSQPPRIASKVAGLIKKAFEYPDQIILIIPSVVFVEIFEQFILDEEQQARFKAEVLEPVRQAPNIEIRPVDVEVLENFILLEDPSIKLENHDRIILATAVALKSPLITSDPEVAKYVKRHRVIPRIINPLRN